MIISVPQSSLTGRSAPFLLQPAMATAATASYSICNRIYNISLNHYSISIPANFSQRNSPKPLKLCLKHQQCTSSILVSLSHVRVACSPSDGAEVAQEVEPREEQPEREKEGQELPWDSDEEKRLYVGNLPFSMTSHELTKLFEEAGSVESAEIVYDRVTDRSRGFGFVTMASVEDAKKAIRMFDGSQVGGRTAKVNFPEVPRGKERLVMGPRARNNNSNSSGFIDSPYKIYAGNLGWRVTSQDLRDAFADLPGVLSAKVVYEKDSRRSRGFGFVSFENAEAVEAALHAKNGMELEGRPLRLNVAVDKIAFQSQPLSGEDPQEDSSASNELLSSYST